MPPQSLTSEVLWQRHPEAQEWEGYLRIATDCWESKGGFACLADYDTSNERAHLPDGWRSYLVKHPQEDEPKYAWRVRNATFQPMTRLVGETLLAFLLGRAPTRDGSWSELEEWGKDADGQGTDFDGMLRRLAVHGFLFPSAFMLIGAPPGQYASQEEASRAGWQPWVSIVHPESVFDWRRENGRWLAAKLVDVVSEGGISEKRTDWTRARIFEVQDNGTVLLSTYRQDEKGKEATLVDEPVTLPVPEIPLVSLSFAETVLPEALGGAAPLGPVVQENKALYNDGSFLNEHIAAQCLAILTYQEDTNNRQTPPLVIGTGNALRYPPGVNAPDFIAPPATVAETLFKRIDEHIRTIFRLARLEFVLNDANSAPASGVSRAYEFQTTNRALAAMAMRMADAETQIVGHVAAFMGKDADGFRESYQVAYPDDFDIKDLEGQIRRTQDAMLLPFDKYTRAAMLRQLRDDLVDLPPEERSLSDQELEAMQDISATKDEILTASTDKAAVVTVDEARANMGLGPIAGGGSETVTERRARIEAEAQAANAPARPAQPTPFKPTQAADEQPDE